MSKTRRYTFVKSYSYNLLILSFAPHVVKNTPVKLELVKLNSETVSESIDNISGNLSIKNSR